MSLLMVNQGEQILGENMVNKTAPQSLRLMLFKSDTTPADGHTEADYTEADFTGYAYVNLSGASWSVTAGAPTLCQYAQQTFTSTADQTTQNIYGYMVVQQTSGKLMWVERFSDGPYPITNNGDTVRVTVKLNIKKQGE